MIDRVSSSGSNSSSKEDLCVYVFNWEEDGLIALRLPFDFACLTAVGLRPDAQGDKWLNDPPKAGRLTDWLHTANWELPTGGWAMAVAVKKIYVPMKRLGDYVFNWEEDWMIRQEADRLIDWLIDWRVEGLKDCQPTKRKLLMAVVWWLVTSKCQLIYQWKMD